VQQSKFLPFFHLVFLVILSIRLVTFVQIDGCGPMNRQMVWNSLLQLLGLPSAQHQQGGEKMQLYPILLHWLANKSVRPTALRPRGRLPRERASSR
jgi:hypothetical protein